MIQERFPNPKGKILRLREEKYFPTPLDDAKRTCERSMFLMGWNFSLELHNGKIQINCGVVHVFCRSSHSSEDFLKSFS